MPRNPVSRRAAAQGAPARTGREPRAAARPIVVGIATSGGGLDALHAFFGAAPPPGLAFVVVAHVDPAHEGLLPELLAKSTAMRVAHGHDRQLLQADHVYVAPPNRFATIEQGLLRVTEESDRRVGRGVIDTFLRSLAEDHGDRAVAILLSGTGNEGTLGARAIKAGGGLVIAQAPDTASQPGMPKSAIASGLVDLVLPPEEMSEALRIYARGAGVAGGARSTAAETLPGEDLDAILALLRARNSNDFREYRKTTLQRRIKRRMRLSQIDSVPAYLEILRTQPEEVDRLFKDLLIGVTRFFRDPPAFDDLGTRVLASLMRESDADTPIRIWVPGCATGEEAYSIAMVAAEQAEAAQSTRAVRVFATDLDEDALGIARAGAYPESIALDVSPERLTRFFARDDRRYVVAKPIRESIVFAAQNVIGDPPFPRIDLVSCRNVLIYLEPAVHRKLMTTFHFALNPGGYLFLGSAETTDGLGAWFAPVSKESRIFRRIGTAPAASVPGALRHGTPAPNRNGSHGESDSTIAARGTDALLEYLAPAAVVVAPGGQILHVYGAMERYITLPTGQATLDILVLARQPLKAPLRAALLAATRQSRPPALDVDVSRGKTRSTVRITVRALDAPGASERPRLIIFEEPPLAPDRSGPRLKGPATALDARLKGELAAARREHQQLIEQFERGNQELASANQEVLAANEELQSTNQELITSKEELQSINQELSTVNAQLRDKVQEVIAASDDLANLFVTTDLATVFVDERFRIKRFTPAAGQILNMLPADIGRSLGHLATNLVDVDLVRDTRGILATGEPIEKAVDARDGTHYILRMRPYQSGNGMAPPRKPPKQGNNPRINHRKRHDRKHSRASC